MPYHCIQCQAVMDHPEVRVCPMDPGEYSTCVWTPVTYAPPSAPPERSREDRAKLAQIWVLRGPPGARRPMTALEADDRDRAELAQRLASHEAIAALTAEHAADIPAEE